MKKIFITILTLVAISSFASSANAQMMMGGFSNSTEDWDKVVAHTLEEEKEGKEVWGKIQAKEITCAGLREDDHGVLGEYFMGLMMGDSHAAMNAMMMQMHGEEGEEQIHITIGKRLSGCDTSASADNMTGGWMPMMQMTEGGWSSPFGNNQLNHMMGSQYGGMMAGGGTFGIITWIVIMIDLILLGIWLWKKISNK